MLLFLWRVTLLLEGDACRNRPHTYLHWFWGYGWGHGEDTTPDPVVVWPQQGGSQHVIRGRGFCSSGRPWETDCNKWLGCWRAGGDWHLLSCFYCSHFICCYLWVLHISKAQMRWLIDSKVGTQKLVQLSKNQPGYNRLCCSQKTLISLPGYFSPCKLPCTKSNVPMPESYSARHSKLNTWGCLDSGTATFIKYQRKLISDFHLSSKTSN